jgi:RNA polymerase sigma-70 factor (ECF subfamily)
MADTPDNNRDIANAQAGRAPMSLREVKAWFVREVLPLESALIHFLHHNWRNQADIDDLLQEVYMRLTAAAQKEIPAQTKAFVFSTARNLLIDRVRREQVVPIEAVADLDALGVAIDEPGPDRSVMARDELRRVQAALDRLPPRAREALLLRRVDGLTRAEIAERMGIGEGTVKEYLAESVCALADMLYGEVDIARRRP